ncbi:MAG: low temperature requirement protein A [Lachnospiraceae bacterium]|nr:low temperature requirement protein A [Lachnospiraceae bacterium]
MKNRKTKSPLLLLLAALVFGALVELIGFQMDDLLLKVRRTEPVSLDLSTLPEYDGTGIPLLPEDSSYSFNHLSVPAQRVTITTSGAPQMLAGTLSLCDTSSSYKTQGAGHFLVNPGGSTSSFTVRLNSHGPLSRLRVTFLDSTEPVWITSVVFNQAAFHFSWVRMLLFSTVFFLIFLVWQYKLWTLVLDLEERPHRLLVLCSMVLCLLFSGLIFYEMSPSHSWLAPLPDQQSLEKYGNNGIEDVYAQQLDAFEKGQLHLDLGVNPQLDQLTNVYDKGERDKKDVAYHWDRAYYQGSYYSYFGLAPLFTIYYPVYWLTGMVPTGLLCTFVLTIFSILGTFGAFYTLLTYFRLQANLLLCLLGVPAVTCGGMLYMLQSNTNFYYYPVLSGLGWLMIFLICFFGACMATPQSLGSLKNRSFPKSAHSERLPHFRRSLLFFFAGLAVVMLVLSRPNLLLLAVSFALPSALSILLNRQSSWRHKLADVLPFLIPVLIGAAGICWFNYVRFDSITEFGTSYQLTESDIRYNAFTLSFHHFKAMLYHYFAHPLVWQEFFPFLRLSGESCFDFGNYLYFECGAGLLNLPLNFGIFLMGWTIFSSSPRKAPYQKSTYILALLGILGLGYLDFSMGGVHIRYTCDLALVVAVLSLLLLLEHVSFTNVKSGQILYGISLVLCISTILIGIFMVFSNENNYLAKINPDFYIRVARLLRNW